MAHQNLSKNHIAVLTAIAISEFKKYESETQFLSASNKLLGDDNLPLISIDEFKKLEQDLIMCGMISKLDGNYSFIANVSYKQRLHKDPKTLVKERGLKSDKIHLLNKFLLRKDEKYGIIFNCDGKGSIELPDGTIEYINLDTLDKRLAKERNIQNKAGAGGGHKWVIDHEVHTDVKPKTEFRKYIQEQYVI